ADERKTPRPLLQHERKILRTQRRVDCGVYISRGRVEVDRQDGRLPPTLALMFDKMLVAHDRHAHWIVRDSSAVFLCCRRSRRPAAPLPLEFLYCGPMPYPPPLRNENAFRGRPCWDFIKIA
ncbi:hypothetical protein, partial [Ralstonia mannitolilytica]